MIGASNLTAFAGINGPYPNAGAVGLQLDNVNFGLAFFKAADGLKSDYGFGLRFHGPFVTPLRIDVARSTEGLRLVFATSPVF